MNARFSYPPEMLGHWTLVNHDNLRFMKLYLDGANRLCVDYSSFHAITIGSALQTEADTFEFDYAFGYDIAEMDSRPYLLREAGIRPRPSLDQPGHSFDNGFMVLPAIKCRLNDEKLRQTLSARDDDGNIPLLPVINRIIDFDIENRFRHARYECSRDDYIRRIIRDTHTDFTRLITGQPDIGNIAQNIIDGMYFGEFGERLFEMDMAKCTTFGDSFSLKLLHDIHSHAIAAAERNDDSPTDILCRTLLDVKRACI